MPSAAELEIADATMSDGAATGEAISDEAIFGGAISDEELTALALAADPDAPLPDDAVSIFDATAGDGLLPAWYMPTATSRRGGGWRSTVVAVVIAGFLVVAASGFCVTYGLLEIA